MSKRSLPLAALLVILAIAFMARQGLAGEPKVYKVGDKISDFAFKSDQGKTVKLSDYRGKIVILAIFATWCGPCNEEAPHLEKEVLQQFKSKNVQVLSLSTQEGPGDPFPKLKAFRKKHKVTYPILSDENATVIQKFGMFGLPTLLIIDKNGKYVANPTDVNAIVAKLQKMVK